LKPSSSLVQACCAKSPHPATPRPNQISQDSSNTICNKSNGPLANNRYTAHQQQAVPCWLHYYYKSLALNRCHAQALPPPVRFQGPSYNHLHRSPSYRPPAVHHQLPYYGPVFVIGVVRPRLCRILSIAAGFHCRFLTSPVVTCETKFHQPPSSVRLREIPQPQPRPSQLNSSFHQSRQS
jgi:hypothetical protein